MAEIIYRPYESGRLGKPDRIDAAIAHELAAHFLAKDPSSRINGRVDGSWDPVSDRPKVILTGEISSGLLQGPNVDEELSEIVTHTYNRINQDRLGPKDIIVVNDYKPQSYKLASNGDAGDTGMAMAVATKDSPLNIPYERFIAVEIRKLIDKIYQQGGKVPHELARSSGVDSIPGLRADGKIEVGAMFDGEEFYGIGDVVVAANHEPGAPYAKLKDVVESYIPDVLATTGHKTKTDPKVVINSLGPWDDQGGWKVDDGSSEAKPHEDYFGNRGNMEDAPWGEDWSKMSGIGSAHAFHIAKQVVNNGLADAAYVVLGYDIGSPKARILNVTTNGTAHASQNEIEKWVKANVPLDFKTIRDTYGFRDPALFKLIASNLDLFHDHSYPWQDLHAFKR